LRALRWLSRAAWPGLVALAAGTAHAGLRAPVAGTGDLEFSLDAPVFPAELGARVDVAASITHPHLRFVPGPGGLSSVVELHLKLARQGLVAVDTSQVYVLHAQSAQDAADPLRYQLVELSLPVPPGRWALTAELVDRQGRRGGLMGGDVRGRGSGVLDVPDWSAPGSALTPPDAQPAPPRLSDPEFRVPSRRGELLPHPDRLYGVEQDSLLAYVEVRDALPQQDLTVTFAVVDPQSGTIDSDEVHLAAGSDRRAALYSLPLASFLEGSYVLRATPSWDAAAATESEFSVSWRIESAAPSQRDLKLEAEILLNGDDLDAWRKASPAVQLQRLQELWTALDPTPGTLENEVYSEFLARVAYARRYFGEQLMPGPRTDRGRTYIRFGPPAEISLEVIPYSGEDLMDAIVMVHDVGALERPGVAFKQAVPKTESPGIEAQRDRERNDSHSGKEGAFELWRYQLYGHPLVASQSIFSQDINLRFLFVDRLGTGEYRMEFSNLAEKR
jgi:GWxTD domain-containing protein